MNFNQFENYNYFFIKILKMKKTFFIPVLMLFLAYTGSAQSTYVVDGKHSALVFSVGYNYSEFWGSFGNMQGKVVLKDEKNFATATVEFWLDMNSINTNSEARDGHLQSERYLNTAKDSSATFKSKYIKPLGDNSYEMTGDLTIGGKTLSQTVLVKVTGQGEVGEGDKRRTIMGFKVNFSFNRSNYGIMGGLPSVTDKVDIIMSLHTVKE